MQTAGPDIDRPIFALGTGRSGTTLFLHLMSRHPDVAWFSNLAVRMPGVPALALCSRVLDLPLIGERLPRWRIVPKPSEAYPILNHATASAFTRPHPLTADDVTPEAARKFRGLVRSCMRWQGKPRFLNKHTGFPRTDYLSAIFPDALFIHVVRDGRAVVQSLMRVDFWDGTPDSWCWGPMKPEYEREYHDSGKDPLILAAITWKTLMECITQAQKRLPPDRFLQLRYDHLVADVPAELDRVLEWTGLPRSGVFDRCTARVKISAADHKWRTALDKDQIEKLERSLGPHLERYGFEI